MSDLFNNPMVEQARQNMTPEQIEEYKAIGEKIHTIDYTNHETETAEPLIEFIAYTSELAKAGLHPKFMTDDEKTALKNHYGDLWYEKVGYTKEDVIGVDVVSVDVVRPDVEETKEACVSEACNYPSGGASVKDM